MKNFNYRVGLLVLVISLVVFFAGNYFFNNYKVNYALQNDLKQITGVQKVKIESQSTAYEIDLALGQVEDLQQVFAQVQEKVEDSLAEETYNLKFTVPEKFSQQLETKVELALYEACQTGEFVKLGQRIKNYQTKYNLQRTVIQVDDDYIYLSLIKDNQVLYKVISRQRKG